MKTDPEIVVSELEAHLGYWLRRVSNPVSGAFAKALQIRQTSVAEWVALSRIYSRQRITAGELADLMGMTRGAISKVLDRLEKKEWVLSAVSPEDNRVHRITLTSKGEQILPELARIADHNDKQFFDCLSAEEQATFRRLLQKLVHLNHWNNAPLE